MARNLVVCCDGTWNHPDQTEGGLPSPTNVVKLRNLCVEDETQQVYYHPGVGADGSKVERLLGGGMGMGLDKNILSAYAWLCRHYQRGDHIFLFGFSRGAYTARSLGGFVTRCGLLDLGVFGKEGDAAAWQAIEDVYQAGYRAPRPTQTWKSNRVFLPSDRDDGRVGVHFIGVWDTVGALGVPDDMVVLDQFLDDPHRYRFHDTRLSDAVTHARHAVAMDERRASFAPTLWTGHEGRPANSVVQLWFPGTHCDVGGGHARTGLSDRALQWMAEEAAAQGLRIKSSGLSQLAPDPRGVLHDSLTGLWRHMRTLPRAVPPVRASGVGVEIDRSTWERHEDPPLSQAPYWPSRILEVGEEAELDIYAREHWNATGIYLEAGASYQFTASGEWLDKGLACSPAGSADGKFHAGELAHLLGSLIGKAESLYQKLSDKKHADWWATRRNEEAAWFALIGMLANQESADGGGTPSLGETFAIGSGASISPARSGYLYCYANDAWSFYDNNRGAVQLKIRRSR